MWFCRDSRVPPYVSGNPGILVLAGLLAGIWVMLMLGSSVVCENDSCILEFP